MSLRCCCAQPYTAKQFENNSGFAELGRIDIGSNQGSIRASSTDVWCLLATNVVVTGGYRRVKRYDTSLVFEQNYDNAYTTGLATLGRGLDVSSGGTVLIEASRSVAVSGRTAVASFDMSGTKTWDTSCDAIGFFHTSKALCIDSSDNGYFLVDQAGSPHVYKFNSSGVKQWVTSVGTGTGTGIAIDSAGHVWTCWQDAANSKLARLDASGVAGATLTLSTRTVLCIRGDGGTGVWTLDSGKKYERFDSTNASVASWTDSDQQSRSFAVDSSNNIYGNIATAGVCKVRKYNSSGTTQWTSGDVGWPGGTPADIIADASYVYLCGDRVTA